MKAQLTNFRKSGSYYVHYTNLYQVRQRNGRNFEVEFFDARGIWKSTGTRNLSEVEEAISRMLMKVGKKTVTGLTFGEFAKNFFARSDEESIYYHNIKFNKIYNATWYDAHQGRLENYIMPMFKDWYLQDITDVAIEDWYIGLNSYADKNKPIADNTKNKIIYTFSYVMQEAKRKKLIDKNPCENVENIKEVQKKREHFTINEIKALFPEDRMRLVQIWGSLQYALFFSIMVDTGWRCGEVSALKRENFIGDGIYTESSVDFYTGRAKSSIKTTSKGQKYKVGILSDYTLELYQDFIKTWEHEYLFYVGNASRYLNTPDRSNRALRFACEEAGIDRRGRTEHCFRHSFDTYMLNHLDSTLTEADVRELMAHTGYRPEYDHRTGRDIIDKLTDKIKPKVNGLRA